MKTLIIPDVHNRVELASRILESVTHDAVVWLGDYFDNFGDSPDDAEKTAKFILSAPGTKLMGNHDIAYRYDGGYCRCPGWTMFKNFRIGDVIKNWRDFKVFTEVDGYLLSHAGFQPKFLSGVLDLEAENVEFLRRMKGRQFHPWLSVTKSRGGMQTIAGPFWCDWNEFMPSEGIKQIVGHTPSDAPRENDGNWCIDTHSNHYGIIEDGHFTVHPVEDILKGN